jgi:hypothetical protein
MSTRMSETADEVIGRSELRRDQGSWSIKEDNGLFGWPSWRLTIN